MKTRGLFIPFVALVAIGLVLFPPAGVRVAKAGAGCTLSTLDATYGFAVNGLVPTTNATAPHLGNFVPLAAGGTFTFDGSGNISRNFMLSFGGQIIPISDTGSYTINSNAPARLFFQL